MFVCSYILLCSSPPQSSLSVNSLSHVRLSRVIKIILTYLHRTVIGRAWLLFCYNRWWTAFNSDRPRDFHDKIPALLHPIWGGGDFEGYPRWPFSMVCL